MSEFELKYNLMTRIFGTPIWTQDSDGGCRRRRAFRSSGGVLMARKILGWIALNDDGTSHGTYVIKWWRR